MFINFFLVNPEGLNLNQSLSSTSQDINNTPAMFMKQIANCEFTFCYSL